MKTQLIAFLKDDTKIYNLWLYVMAGLFVILVFKHLLKSTRIKPIVFDQLILFVTVLFFAVVIGNILYTENYSSLWNLILVFALVFLQRKMPKLLKWYDDKIDGLGEHMKNRQ